MNSRRGFIASSISIALAGCGGTQSTNQTRSESSPPDRDPPSFLEGTTIDEFDLKQLEYPRRPQWARNPYGEPYCPFSIEQVLDQPLVYNKEVDGETGHHPLRTTRYMMTFLEGYRETGESAFIQRVEEMAAELLDNHTTSIGGSLMLDYGFEFQEISAPWSSGMAQGTGLSTFLRLYEITNDEKYLDIAEDILQSFSMTKELASERWVANITGDHYWIEEYPGGRAKHVLNGFVVGLWGPYEYWAKTGDQDALQIFQAGATTLRDNWRMYRNAGGTSFYSSRRSYPVNDDYHSLHIEQMKKLSNITGDQEFNNAASTLYQDKRVVHRPSKWFVRDLHLFRDVSTSVESFNSLKFTEWPQWFKEETVSSDTLKKWGDLAFYDDEVGQTHPLETARRIMQLCYSYNQTDQEIYLQSAIDISDSLIETAVSYQNALYLPYQFDFNVHGNSNYTLSKPWFSGMAQGVALSAFTRLYRITGLDRFYEAAVRVYQSFLITDNSGENPWTAVKEDGYYWIEEYPLNTPPKTLNGKIFAIWGLYEFWQEFGNELAKTVLSAAVTTVKENIDRFRVPGEPSYYCLGHDVQSSNYHDTHVRQLGKLAKITGDSYFQEMSRLFNSDN